MNNEIIIQITSGRGPAECCWVVSQVLKTILHEAEKKGFCTEVISRTHGMEASTLISAVIKLQGAAVASFAQEWTGTVLWVGQSPYRKFHKRKNWYVGVNVVDAGETHAWDEKDITYQTLRASGPGGQHVNKTETAVRAIHIPTGIQVTASDNRSQLQNKKLATTRLQDKLMAWRFAELLKNEQSQWNQHNLLERGNPVKVFRGRDFMESSLEI